MKAQFRPLLATWMLITACSGSKISVLRDDSAAHTGTHGDSGAENDTGEPIREPDPDPYPTWLATQTIDGGTFSMGCTQPDTWDCAADESPVRTVTLSSFVMLQTEVPRGMYRALMGTAPRPPDCTQDDCALAGITFAEAIAFCNSLSEAEGLTPAYSTAGGTISWNRDANGYRLPTEAEWEYAARSGLQLIYAGSADLDAVAWTAESAGGRIHNVGEKTPNSFGLYDMSGNVAEWVWDPYAPYDPSLTTDPIAVGDLSTRVVRGGAYDQPAASARISARDAYGAAGARLNIGFRVVRAP